MSAAPDQSRRRTVEPFNERAPAELPVTGGDGTPAARAAVITRWLAAEAPHEADVNAMVDGFAVRLLEAGLPLARMTMHIQVLNPQVSRAMREWWRGRGTTHYTRPHGIERTADYVGSPVQYVTERRAWLIRRLDAATDAEFPLLAGLRRQGLTHYVMAPIRFSDGTVNAASWASDAPQGFSDADVALLRAITPTLSLLMEMRAVRRMAAELMATYLGPETGARVLAGEIQRGHTQTMRAAILLADLESSTRYAAAHSADAVVARLNRYFDCVAPPVEGRGGEVLKFVGDGMMAIFRDEPGDGGDCRACWRALEAAQAALAAIDATNETAQPPHEPPLAARLALHHGTVAYGNVGAPDRLDFTVVGHDVNLAYRIERQAAALRLPLVMSAAFAANLRGAAVSLGRFALRSVDEAEELFAPDEAAMPAARFRHAAG